MGLDFESIVNDVEIVEPSKPRLPEVKGKRERISLYLKYLPENFEPPEEVDATELLLKYDSVCPILSEGSIVRTKNGFRLIHDFTDPRAGRVSHVADLIANENRKEFEIQTVSAIPRLNPSSMSLNRFVGKLSKAIDGFAGLLEYYAQGRSFWVLVEIVYD